MTRGLKLNTMQAYEAYEKQKAEIKQAIKQLQESLKKHEKMQTNNQYNWGYVGELCAVLSHLENANEVIKL